MSTLAWYCSMHINILNREKSGHMTGTKQSMAQSACHMRKSLSRCSPDERMSRSTGGTVDVCKHSDKRSADTSAACSLPNCTALPMTCSARLTSQDEV